MQFPLIKMKAGMEQPTSRKIRSESLEKKII